MPHEPGTQGLSSQMAYRALELLGDRQWHNTDDVLRELAKLVPPGRAMRRTEQERRNASSKPSNRAQAKVIGERQRPLPIDRQIASGARRICYDFLHSSKAFEHRGVKRQGNVTMSPDRQVRLVGVLRQTLPGRPSTQELLRQSEEQRQELQRRNEQLTAALEKATAYLGEHGHRRMAKVLREELDRAIFGD